MVASNLLGAAFKARAILTIFSKLTLHSAPTAPGNLPLLLAWPARGASGRLHRSRGGPPRPTATLDRRLGPRGGMKFKFGSTPLLSSIELARFVGFDLTQAEPGQILGITEAALSKFEKGQRLPTLEVLLKLRAFCGKPIDWIITGEESVPSPPHMSLAIPHT
jgi:DNA-binding XRE family transcriptional regulator